MPGAGSSARRIVARMTTLEIVRRRVATGDAERFIAARGPMIDVLAARPGVAEYFGLIEAVLADESGDIVATAAGDPA